MRSMDVFSGSPAVEFTDLDIIQEVITEDRERLQLPAPPPPPADLLCEPQNHRMLGPDSYSSKPVLVPRCTAPKIPASFPVSSLQSCSREMASAHPCRGGAPHLTPPRGRVVPPCHVTSKSRVGPSPRAPTDADLLERILEKPKLVVVEEPKERGMRFRYECEGRSAGSILGTSSTTTTKTQPTVEIQGPIERMKKVTLTVSLVTKDIPYRPHPHCLVGKDCPEGSGICVVSFNPHSNRRHSFANLGIQCVRRKEMDASLQKRRSQNIDPFRTGESKSIEDMDMNVVRLCFQCELEWEDGRKDSLNPVVSNPIYDKKATTTSQLKISCLNLHKGPCTGKTEIYMLCDKVQKDDIEIIFRHGLWEAKGEFAQTDVHRQIAIVFKTPSYQEQDITEETEVEILLRRISDRMDSEPVTFTYLPHNPDPYEVKRKRKIKTDISITERPCESAHSPFVMETSSPQPCQFLAAETAMEPLPPPGDLSYNNHQETNPSTQSYDANDDLSIFNQLLEMPSFREMLSDPALSSSLPSFEQAPEGGSFAGVDVNFNPALGTYSQDFSQYNDLHFNHMVNESHTSQAEESPSLKVQVKTEDDL